MLRPRRRLWQPAGQSAAYHAVHNPSQETRALYARPDEQSSEAAAHRRAPHTAHGSSMQQQPNNHLGNTTTILPQLT